MSGAASGAIDGTVLRRAFGCFPSGVTAVCGLVGGEPTGMAASSFTSVSLDPPLVSVCVANTSATWQRLRGLDRLGVSVLGAVHETACRQLAAKDGDRFAGVSWHATAEGAVLIGDATLTLACSLDAEVPAGDHQIALLRIHEVEAAPHVAPIVFHLSRFRRLAADA
jgi:flavin reductase (DIM6/NTAB) family NADH-FMN oxidoreductase RutF